MGLMNLSSHDEKVTSDKKINCNSYQRHEGKNRYFCHHFSVIFKIRKKIFIFIYLFIFVRLTFGKVEIDGYTGPGREIDIRYKFGLKVILKGLGISEQKLNLSLFLSD